MTAEWAFLIWVSVVTLVLISAPEVWHRWVLSTWVGRVAERLFTKVSEWFERRIPS